MTLLGIVYTLDFRRIASQLEYPRVLPVGPVVIIKPSEKYLVCTSVFCAQASHL